MNDRTLAQLIQDRIGVAYGGRQADFARALGVSTSTVNAWLKGRIALPQLEIRRRLAAELGVRHVELFVLAGELDPDEVGPPAPAPFPPDDPRSQVVAELRGLSLPDARDVADMVHLFVTSLRRQNGTPGR